MRELATPLIELTARAGEEKMIAFRAWRHAAKAPFHLRAGPRILTPVPRASSACSAWCARVGRDAWVEPRWKGMDE